MQSKDRLRKKYLSIRKKKYFDISSNFFNPLLRLIKKKYTKKNLTLSIYYPASYEVNVIKLLDIANTDKIKMVLPMIINGNSMCFYRWKKGDILQVNRYGMLEPSMSTRKVVPNIMLVPLLAFDKEKNRLGYGGGFYDKFINKYLKSNKNLTTIGIAFSFQKYNKLPTSKNDVKLNYILTEKGLIK